VGCVVDCRIDIEAEIDGLFRLAPAAFTQARNELAARLQKAGDTQDAKRVKALAKPSASAWAVNQLHWTAQQDLQALLDAGERLREAQGAGGAELREAIAQQRAALAVASKRAQSILTEGGHSVTPAVVRRVQRTLEALAVYGAKQPTPGAGRLTEDLEPPGFEALSGLIVGPAAAPPQAPEPRTSPATPAAARAERESLVAEIQALRRKATEARAAHEAAQHRREQAARDRARAERSLAEAETELRAAQAHEASAQDAAEQAAEAVSEAEQALGAKTGRP
jgi:DNA repair exonuclease SbcCD ATPase subunit